MTRNRNTADLKPSQFSVEYYSQRATAGLIISEGILVSPHKLPQWPHIPLLTTEEHADAWKRVVEGVHAEGGKMFMQAWHAGQNEVLDEKGFEGAVGEFRRAAVLAEGAGFDGVEVLAQG
jgi:2,4-dienoyl-CoA reductase-like NADH-dependent reductase (Old Yellow Enzyme family)